MNSSQVTLKVSNNAVSSKRSAYEANCFSSTNSNANESSKNNSDMHFQIQQYLQQIDELLLKHQHTKLSKNDCISEFKTSKKWKWIQKFYCKPSVFILTDLKDQVEEEIKSKSENLSKKDVKEKVDKLIEMIEADFVKKYGNLSQGEIKKD